MTEPDPKKVLKLYDRHSRRRRWQKWQARTSKIATGFLGLLLGAGLLYVGTLVYQRLEEDEARLNALVTTLARQEAPKSLATAAAGAPPPTPTAAPGDIWKSGKWEAEAQKYIKAQLAAAPSSANPPAHRHPQ